MTETLEEEMDRQALRVNAELRRREALPKIETGVKITKGSRWMDANGWERGPMYERVPGVWADDDLTSMFHVNGIVIHSTVEDPRNLQDPITE
jgi:hypothetical protein